MFKLTLDLLGIECVLAGGEGSPRAEDGRRKPSALQYP